MIEYIIKCQLKEMRQESDIFKQKYPFFKALNIKSMIRKVRPKRRYGDDSEPMGNDFFEFSVHSYDDLQMSFYNILFQHLGIKFQVSNSRKKGEVIHSFHVSLESSHLTTSYTENHKILYNLIFLLQSEDRANRNLALEMLPTSLQLLESSGEL